MTHPRAFAPALILPVLILPVLILSAAPAPAAPVLRSYAGAGGVRLERPAGLAPSTDFSGRALMAGGWRLMWDGAPPGPGTGVVRFQRIAVPGPGEHGAATEMLQIGYSRNPAVVRTCLRRGLVSGTSRRVADRMIGGRRWAAYAGGDAGMSQAITALDLRTVANGACYAVARIGYVVRAAEAPPAGTPAQRDVAAAMDRMLATLRVVAR